MRKFVVLMCGVIVPMMMFAQPSLDTLRHLDVQPLGSYSAIWGYTATDGREYALLGVNGSSSVPYPGGTSIIDITDEDNVRQVAFIPGLNSSWREMKTYKHYAYVVTEAGGGVQIINLSQLPDTAWLVRSFNYSNGGKSISRSHSVSLHDGFLYLNGCANWSPGGMVIFDLRNDPENPQFAGEYQPEYIHDSYVLRDTIYGSAINSGGGLVIADARNKSNITPIGKISYTGSGTHNAWVTKDRGYVVTTDEIGNTPKTLKVWNIQNLPTIPTTTTATFTSTPGQIEHNITIRGDFAYVAWYSAGMVVVDLTNPPVPVLADAYDTSPSTSGYSGVWGVYPFFPSGKVIAGDMQNGLWVFRFEGLQPRQPVTLLEPQHDDTVGGPVTLRWSKAADLSDDPHSYEIHIIGDNGDEMMTSADTVLEVPDLLPDQYTWYIVTRDEWNNTASVDTFSFVLGNINSVTPAGQPHHFLLAQNYPNPFNPVTLIQYEIAKASHVSLKVFNVLGEEVAELVSGVNSPGVYQVSFDAERLASGLYFYRLQADGFVQTRKMVVMR
ncbi:MAG: choice-of-anchor B family protein [Bacteroidota bacterium]